MKPLLRNLLIGLGAALLAACGGDDNASAGPPATPPTAQASAASTTVEIPSTVTLNGAASVAGTGGGALTYRWTLAGRPANSSAELSGATTASPSFVADKPGDYTADLIVNDGRTDSAPARVVVKATSPYPVASTAAAIGVQLGTATVGLDGTASTPPTGQDGPVSYLWTLKSKPDGSGSSLLDWDKGNATLIVDVEGEYLVHLVVSHGGVDSEPALVTVTVSKGNAPPVAVAAPVTVKLGQEVVLDGTQSYDPDNQPLQYRWRWAAEHLDTPPYVARPELLEANTATARFSPVAVGGYKLLFYVYDGTWQSTEITVDVTVEKPADFPAQNKAPVGKLVAMGYYPSSSVGEQEVGLRANFNFDGYDPEGEPLQIVSTELVSKPAGSAAFLEDTTTYTPGTKKIQVLDREGDYKVRFVVSDGVNQVTSEATMRARIGGINNRPLAGRATPVAESVLVGSPIIFESSASDPDRDPLVFSWSLLQQPDGSKATIEPLLDAEAGTYRRARVIPDLPGVYIASYVVEDDRGMRPAEPGEGTARAKSSNNAPVIRRVAFRTQFTQLRDGDPYQLLPCMALNFIPVVVDPDGDRVYTRRELISAPAGGKYGQNRAECNQAAENTFSLPGTYVFRYLVSDGIAELPAYDFTVEVDAIGGAKGVRLDDAFYLNGALNRRTGQPWPYLLDLPDETYTGNGSSTPATAPQLSSTFQLTAVDGDYTLVDLQVEHINGTTLTPYFEGISEGQVIRMGETLEFRLLNPPFGCLRSDEILREGFRWRFRVKEIPQATFFHEQWRSAILNNGATPWPACAGS